MGQEATVGTKGRAPQAARPKSSAGAPAPAAIKPPETPVPAAETTAADTSVEEEDDDPGLAEFLKRSGLTSEPTDPAGNDGVN